VSETQEKEENTKRRAESLVLPNVISCCLVEERMKKRKLERKERIQAKRKLEIYLKKTKRALQLALRRN